MVKMSCILIFMSFWVIHSDRDVCVNPVSHELSVLSITKNRRKSVNVSSRPHYGDPTLSDHLFVMDRDYESCSDRDDHKRCQFRVKRGYCSNKKWFMAHHCPHSCGYCHILNDNIRCQRSPQAKPAIIAGDIDFMFSRLLTNFPQFSPQILHRDPWLILLSNVFNDSECLEMIQSVSKSNKIFERSKTHGIWNPLGQYFEQNVDPFRTSKQCWCNGNCWNMPIMQKMSKTIENITNVKYKYFEYPQILKYEKNNYYAIHHDELDDNGLEGRRIYTVFLYLNTPKKGGETRFDQLNITIPAKIGNVAIWHSVLNDDPMLIDDRTTHESLPVEEGIKFAANWWIHLYDYHHTHHLNCQRMQ
eukprot:462933_1